MERLKRRADFLRVAAGRRKVVTAGVVVQVAPAPDGPGRVGFTASRKVGKAVDRNRAKRRLRALADEVLPVALRPELDIVLIARTATVDRAFDKLRADLMYALRKLDARRPKAEA